VEKVKISCLCRKSDLNFLVVQPISQSLYTSRLSCRNQKTIFLQITFICYFFFSLSNVSVLLLLLLLLSLTANGFLPGGSCTELQCYSKINTYMLHNHTNNTHTRHKIHRTMKDQTQQCACANNEKTLLPMNTILLELSCVEFHFLS
jgi:hypothetical protein